MKRIISTILALAVSSAILPMNIVSAKNDELPMVINNKYINMAVKTDGSLWCWSDNDYGQVGNGVRLTDVIEPVKVMEDVKTISAGTYHCMALKEDNTLWTWGRNNVGQLGIGSLDNCPAPTKVLDDVKYIWAGSLSSMAIKNDGSLWVCGQNVYGQLGDGTEKDRSVFVKIMDNVKEAKMHWFFGAAIKEDGSLWIWGANEVGQIGIGTKSNKEHQLNPVKVMEDVKTITYIGSSQIMVIKEDNSLWGWGANGQNALGCGEKEDILSPMKIMDNVKSAQLYQIITLNNELYTWDKYTEPKMSMSGVKQSDYNILKTSDHVVKTDGSLWGWGDNEYGQLGNGTTEKSENPVKIMDNVDYINCVEDDRRYFAVKNDGGLWAWGLNNDNLGFKTPGEYQVVTTPEKVMQLCAFAIAGKNIINKNEEAVLEATYYDENGNPHADADVDWYCSDTTVAQITPWGNKLTVKGLKSGKVTIEAVHRPTGEVASFELEVLEYKLSLENAYNFLVDTKKNIPYSVSLGDETVTADKNIQWTVEKAEGAKLNVISDEKTSGYARNIYLEFSEPGECELVAKIDGVEVARIKINIIGSIYDMAENESVTRAKVLANNMMYDYYTNMYESTPIIYTENMNLMVSAAYGFLDKLFANGVDFSKYYETVLVDILTGDTYKEYLDSYGNPLSEKIEENLVMQIANIADSGMDTLNPFNDLMQDVSKISKSDSFKFSAFFEAAFLAKDFIVEASKVVPSVSALGVTAKATIDALDQIKASTDNGYLKAACNNVKERYVEIVNDETMAKQKQILNGGLEPLKECFFLKLSATALTLLGGGWIVAGTNAGTAVNNLLMNVDEITAQAIVLSTYVELEEVMRKAIDDAQSGFESDPTLESATNFMAITDLYKAMLIKGCESTTKYVDAVEDGDKNVEFFWGEYTPMNLFDLYENDVDYNGAKEVIKERQNVIANADFYSLEGLDIAEIIAEVKSTEPSAWAETEINEAIGKGLLPENLRFNYTENITRAEFCTLLTKLLEKKTGKEIKELVKEKGVQIKSPFEDTYYEYVDYIYKLGIVNGTCENRFDPLENITREQAATMLTRAADVLGYDTAYQNAVESGISDWAADGVGFVTENGIMNGTGEGFSPKGTYTKEQAIATFVRMYNNLK